ncbi:MAG TPA: hypothetical protein VM282_21600 [Acidimicrobiales bacterium]|nr:hypothetical protein [Acidimicrobiales bacterium]
MTMTSSSPWHVDRVAPEVVERLAQAHEPDPKAVAAGVDIISDPHRVDDDGFNWTRLHHACNVADVVPGAAVVVGSVIGEYLAKVIAWDFEVSDDDPIVVLELLPIRPSKVQGALAQRPPTG